MRIFDPQNAFFRAVARITDVVGVSLLWAFLSLPLVTLGAASAALYECARRCLRTGEGGAFGCFFSVFRAALRPALLPSLAWSAIGLGLAAGFRVLAFLAAAGERAALFQLAVFCVLLVIPAGTVCWLFPLSVRRPLGFAALNLTALRLALAHLPATLLLLGLTGLSAYLCWRWWLPVLALPALCAAVCAPVMERVFAAEGFAGPPA